MALLALQSQINSVNTFRTNKGRSSLKIKNYNNLAPARHALKSLARPVGQAKNLDAHVSVARVRPSSYMMFFERFPVFFKSDLIIIHFFRFGKGVFAS